MKPLDGGPDGREQRGGVGAAGDARSPPMRSENGSCPSPSGGPHRLRQCGVRGPRHALTPISAGPRIRCPGVCRAGWPPGPAVRRVPPDGPVGPPPGSWRVIGHIPAGLAAWRAGGRWLMGRLRRSARPPGSWRVTGHIPAGLAALAGPGGRWLMGRPAPVRPAPWELAGSSGTSQPGLAGWPRYSGASPPASGCARRSCRQTLIHWAGTQAELGEHGRRRSGPFALGHCGPGCGRRG